MAPRSNWKGYLKLGLVTCPIKLYPATSSKDKIRFNQLHKDTLNRINVKPVDPELGLVERSDLVRGYEYEKNKYIIIDEDDLASVKIESTHTINIEAFVDEDDLDVIYMDSPYYLAPDGAMAEETFAVLREAMRSSGKVAIGRLVLSSRERVVAITPRDKGMFLSTLRNPSEVRNTREYFLDISDEKPDEEMLQMAEQLIAQKTKSFDPGDYEDRYETALMDMIKRKLKGTKPVVAAPASSENVIDLMAALKASLGKTKPPARSKARAGKKTAARPARKAAGKKRA